jgi:hypothetical protein
LVALDRVFNAGDLFGERRALFCKRVAVGVVARGGLCDGVADEASVAVEAGELGEDGGL